ncbi:hypothetical protein AB3X89_40330, partial [Paraburkholderia sp. BR14320]|uniref:hypothetical protein n=1 Tax=unclassified Paraburkholderia TaxID=2615204 RepID=UPI0034CF8D1B
ARGRDYREPRESVEQLRQGRLRQKALVASATNCGPTLLNKAPWNHDSLCSGMAVLFAWNTHLLETRNQLHAACRQIYAHQKTRNQLVAPVIRVGAATRAQSDQACAGYAQAGLADQPPDAL